MNARRLAVFAAVLLLMSATVPATASAAPLPQARIEIQDAPLTRNAVVHIVVVPDPIDTAPPVEEVRLSNDPATNDGLLIHPTTTAQSTDWTLAPGWVPSTLTATGTTRNLYGHTYQFKVRAIDRAGNVGAWAFGSSFRVTGISQASAAVRYAGTWSNSTSTQWWGGTAKSSSRAGSTVSYTFTGKSIAWVGFKASNRGKANVYVNGVLKATVDLRSTTVQKQVVVWAANYSTSAKRTVTIKVLGTSGRPRVDVDGFIVGS